MTEEEKYEILEKIGMIIYAGLNYVQAPSSSHNYCTGHGSFGIIRKVRRKTDGHVRPMPKVLYFRVTELRSYISRYYVVKK